MISNWFTKLKIDDSHPAEATLLACADGELSEKEAAKVRRHLENCWSCRAQLDELQETIKQFVNFRNQVQNPLVEPPPKNWGDFERKLAQSAAENESKKISIPQRLGFWHRFRKSLNFSDWSPAGRQLSIGSLATLLIVALLWQMVGVRSVSAAELLKNSIQAEEQKVGKVNQPVVYQKLWLERAGQKAVDWETWRDVSNSRYRHAVADKGNNRRFISAVFDTPKNDSPEDSVLREVSAILQMNRMNPLQPLSAQSFQTWRNSLSEKKDEIENSSSVDGGEESYVLKTVATGAAENGKITEAALTVDADDWHAERLRILVKSEMGASVYEFVETAYEVVSLPTLSPEIFPRDSKQPAKTEIATASPNSQPSPSVSPSGNANTNLIAQPLPSSSNMNAQPPIIAASAELEVEVLKALNGISADIGEEATVTRTDKGALLVHGVVETPQRKSEILNALAPLAGQPGLSVRIETSQEAQKRIQREQTQTAKNKPRQETGETSVSVQTLEVRDTIPTDAEVRRYLRSRGTSETALNDEINRFATRTINRSNQVLLRALALKNLANRFSEIQLRSMKPEARNEWLNLIAARAREIENQNAALRQELGLVFGGMPAGGGSVDASDEAGLKLAVIRLSELAASNDRAVRAAFTFSSGANADAVKGAQFRLSLGAIEGLANNIESGARRLQSK